MAIQDELRNFIGSLGRNAQQFKRGFTAPVRTAVAPRQTIRQAVPQIQRNIRPIISAAQRNMPRVATQVARQIPQVRIAQDISRVAPTAQKLTTQQGRDDISRRIAEFNPQNPVGRLATNIVLGTPQERQDYLKRQQILKPTGLRGLTVANDPRLQNLTPEQRQAVSDRNKQLQQESIYAIADVSTGGTSKVAREGLEGAAKKIPSPQEAKRIFKKTGEVIDFATTKRPTTKIAVVGEAGTKVTPERFIQQTGKKLEAKDLVNQIDLTKAKDQSALTTGMTDMYRNTERVFGKGNPVTERILRPLDQSKGNFARDVKNISETLKRDVVDNLGIKKGSKESAAVQQFGEKLKSYEDLVKEFGEDRANKIVTADKWFRTQYDRLLADVNAVRAQIYPNQPDKLIPRRDDYYRHFTDITETSGIRNLFDTVANIPSELAGKSEYLKPKSKFLSIAQQRLGNKTDYDAVGGFLDYANAQAYAKNIDPNIEKIRNFVDELATRDTDGKLGRYIADMRGQVDRLAGKTAKIDRAVEGIFGRKGLDVINTMNSRVKANAILGNMSSAISQVFNVPNGVADAGFQNTALGAKRMMQNIASDTDAYAKSNFISERYVDKARSQFNQGILQQPKKFATWLMTAGDELGTKLIWNAQYEKFAKQGLPENKIIQLADEATRRMVGGRGIGEVPLTLDAKTTQLFAPFQVEVNNLWKVQKDFIDEKQFGKLIKLYMTGYMMNNVAKAVRGSDVIFDPIQAVSEAISTFAEEENKGIGAIRAGGRVAGEVLSNIPGGQYIAGSVYPEYGFNIPGTDEKLTREELFGKGDPTRFGAGPLFTGGLTDPLYKLLPNWGGQQLKRTIEGTKSLAKGYAEDKGGNVQFPVEQNLQNTLRAPLFGKYSTTEGQQYTSEEKRALSERESEFFKAGNKGVYTQVQLNRKAEKEKEALKSGKKSDAEMINDKVVKLSNGKFSVLDNKGDINTYDTEEKALIADAKNTVDETGNRTRVGDTLIYKDQDGEVKTKKLSLVRKDAEEYLLTQNISKAKANNDLPNWTKFQEAKIKNLADKLQMLDPEADMVEIIRTQNQIQNIYEDIAKYQSQGGFKKPRKTAKAGQKVKTRTTSQLKLATVKPVTSQLKLTGGTSGTPRRQSQRGIANRSLYT